jgi:hypothetical protein
VFVWVGIVVILLFTAAVGASLIGEGLNGRRVLAEGPVGTFTPTDRECNKEACWWLGTFAATDGAVTAKNVELLDAEKVRRGDPRPAAISKVRLDDHATRPTAYTADYSWRGSVIKGSVLVLVGLAISGGLVTMLRRYRSRATSS